MMFLLCKALDKVLVISRELQIMCTPQTEIIVEQVPIYYTKTWRGWGVFHIFILSSSSVRAKKCL